MFSEPAVLKSLKTNLLKALSLFFYYLLLIIYFIFLLTDVVSVFFCTFPSVFVTTWQDV